MISPVLLNGQKYPKAAGRLICFAGLFGALCDVKTMVHYTRSM